MGMILQRWLSALVLGILLLSSVVFLNALGFEINTISDATTIAHNGCRPPKRRRV